METLLKNEYAKVGRTFLKTIDRLVKDTETKDKRALFKTLNQIHLIDDFSLGLYVANEIGLGDESWFYAYPSRMDTLPNMAMMEILASMRVTKRLYKFLRVNPSAMGAWQIYLLDKAPTVMPVFWHGGYSCCTYIFSLAALNKVKSGRGVDGKKRSLDFSHLTEEDILPAVSFENGKAVVSCCHWNDWSGLMRETCVIQFKDDKVVSVSAGRRKTLVKYDCGICF